MLRLSLALILAASPAAASDENWWDGFGWPGTHNPVRAIVSHQGELYVSDGSCLLRWDDPQWTCVVEASIDALLSLDDQLYVGGSFTQIGGVEASSIARFDGESWHALGRGIQGEVLALAMFEGAIVAGGRFAAAGGELARGLAVWNGSWSELGGGVAHAAAQPEVHSLLVDGDNLYVGGFFQRVGGETSHCVARWRSGSWQSFGSAFTGIVYAIALHEGILWVGGSLLMERFYPLAQWEAGHWVGYGDGLTSLGRCFLVDAGQLLAGGTFSARGLVQWTGGEWVATDLEVGPTVYATAAYDGARILGGGLGIVEGVQVFNIIRWADGTWRRMGPVGEGMSGDLTPLCPLKISPGGAVRALFPFDGQLVATGSFSAAGTTPGPGTANWDGSRWSAMADGISPFGFDLTTWRGQLVAAAVGVLVLQDVNWSPLVEDPSWNGCDGVGAVTVVEYDGDLVAAGHFETIEEVAASSIGRFDGSAWHALGTGIDRWVEDLCTFDGNLVVGGNLTRAGETEVHGVAQWDGAAWSAVGEGLEGIVYALLAHGDDLYAGGDFTVSGAPGATDVARWDGQQWQPLAIGTGGRVLALEWYGDRLVAGGIFEEIGGTLARNVAAFDGVQWQPLGSGIQPTPSGGGVTSLCAWSGRLYLGGTFVAAGGKPSFNIARWRDPEVVAATTLTLFAERTTDGVDLRWSWSPRPPHAARVEIWRAEDGAFHPVALVDGSSWHDPNARADRRYRYRLVTPAGIVSEASTVEVATPRTRIASVAPNPFNPRTEIRLQIARAGPATVRIFDLAGREVWRWRKHVEAGAVTLVWEGLDDAGVDVASGVYLVHLESKAGVDVRRVVRLD